MSHSQFYPAKDSWLEKWQKAKKAGSPGITAFFIDLYGSRKKQPYRRKVFDFYDVKHHSGEFLGFFAANLERMNDEKFTLLRWKDFYGNWVGSGILNITARQHEGLRLVDEAISSGDKYKDDGVINFNDVHINYLERKNAPPKTCTANQFLMQVSSALLMILSSQEYESHLIDSVLADPAKGKEKDKSKGKEKDKNKGKGKEKEKDKGKGKEKEKPKGKEKEEKKPKKKW